MKETVSNANTKDKNLEDIKCLISVFDSVASVMENQDTMMLQLDQLEETLNLLTSMNMGKESQVKQTKKLFDDWANLKKIAKDVKKEINPLVTQETGKNNNNIAKLEEDLKAYFQEMKKRDFYKYDCGKELLRRSLTASSTRLPSSKRKLKTTALLPESSATPTLLTTLSSKLSRSRPKSKTCRPFGNTFPSARSPLRTTNAPLGTTPTAMIWTI